MLALGSCFAQNTGQKLREYKFNININPFGTLFNPISIFKLVNQAALHEKIDNSRAVMNQDVYYHYDLHSDLSALEQNDLLATANKRLQEVSVELPTTTVIIYTFGTSIVYELKTTGEIVANCHKIPSGEFNRRFLEIDEIVDGFQKNREVIKAINKNVRFILTVSPVRHQKESFEQNNVSKSILRIACEKIVKLYEKVEYFPAFEIMMDELRDYRFYADDMLHPSTMATDYIWRKFQDSYFNESTRNILAEWEKIIKALAHKPFYKESARHQLFIHKTIDQLNEFKDKFNIDQELDLLKAQLK